jgi:hypothetical protein
MTQEELTHAIELTAQQAKLTFEPGLVGRILDDVREEPGNLPLLEFALTVLWEARRGNQFLHETYEAMGSLRGAIARRAEETFTRLTPLEQAAVRRIFLQVVRPGEQTEDTRRRATFADIGEALRPVVQHLADARLLVTGRDESAGEEIIEIAHEALIGHWVRLRTWLDEDRAFLLWRQRLRDAIAGWRRTGQDEGGLLRVAPLAEAERWFNERTNDLSPDEVRFIRESMVLRERERAAREQQQHRRMLTALGAALVFLMLAGLAGLQWWRAEKQSQETEQHRQLAEERGQRIQQQLVEFYTEQGRQELLKGDGRRAAVYLSEAYQQASHEAGAQSSVRVLLALAMRLIERVSLDGHTGSVYFATFSPDGTHIVTTSTDGTAKLWNAVKGDFLASFDAHRHWVVTAAFSPDGSRIATASLDGTAKVWEVTNGRSLTTLAGHAGPVLAAAFSRDGSRIVTTSVDRSAKVWDLRLETRSRPEIADLVRRVVPWRLDQGRLIPASPNASAHSTHPSSMRPDSGYQRFSWREPKVPVWLGNRRLRMTWSGTEMPVDHLPIEPYRLAVLNGGHKSWEREIAVIANQVQRVSIDMDQIRITQRDERIGPVIRLTSLSNQQVVYDDAIYLEGMVTAASPIVTFSINGEPLSRHHSRRLFFGHLVSLQPGDNYFLLEAVDEAGNTARQDFIVTRMTEEVRRLNPRLRVFLLPLAKQGQTSLISGTVYDYLFNALVNQRRFELVERQHLEAVLQELKLSQTDLVDPAMAAKIGKLVAADGILMGAISGTPQALEVAVRLIDAETAVVLAAEDVYGEDLTFRGVNTLMEGLSWKIANRLPSTRA